MSPRPDLDLEIANGNGGRDAAFSKTLDTGLRVLDLLAEHPGGMTASELAAAAGIHRTVLYRLLGTLAAHSMVTRTDANRYEIGVGVVALSRAARPQLQASAAQPLTELAEACDATAFMTVLDGEDAVSIQVIEPPRSSFHVAYRVGSRHPATQGAPGIAILSAREPEPGERPDIELARRRGYAVSVGELQPGAWGIAVPVIVPNRRVDTSIGVVAMTARDERETAGRVIATAVTIGSRLT